MELAMKKTAAVLLGILLASGNAFAAGGDAAGAKQDEDQRSLDEVRGDLQKSFDELFTLMGIVAGGLKNGLEEGAKNIQSQLDGSDGTTLISKSDDLKKYTQSRVYKVERRPDGTWKVTLAVVNPNDFPVRLVDLTRDGSVLLIDHEGFAHSALMDEDTPRTLSVPEKSAKKLVFLFPDPDGAKPLKLRLFGEEFPLVQQNVL